MAIEEQREAEAPIHGDMLEAILSHVPLTDLVPACHVSKAWKRAVAYSIGHVNPIKPWLTVHSQSNRAPHVTTTHAYDPRSRVWLEIHEPSMNHVSAVRSSHSTLLYTLTPTKFTFSFDPLHVKWHHVDAPSVWRTDPVVALVGQRVVVAGGTSDFEDDPLAVEMYNLKTQSWETCASMPDALKYSTASAWLSAAVDEHRMHVTEKNSCLTYSLDPDTRIWHGPYDLRPSENVFFCVTGTIRNRFIAVGLVGDAENVSSVKLWEIRGGSEMGCCEELGEMPKEMVEKMKGEGGCVPSIAMAAVGDFVYMYNPWEPDDIIVCEVEHGKCKWGCIRNVALNDGTRMHRLVVSCANVTMKDLQMAVSENWRFAVKGT
ncbi:hypothetical protein L6164_027272 [Bauhinia variegata]|uniref:Uncharacterized protein n=1 Tax=Bauhinia variegata TaxID=167791 RepID=A0ACB9LT40_BAUVA|nr:hypothetical protein L6164_027272 [Bauhinia variegata]